MTENSDPTGTPPPRVWVLGGANLDIVAQTAAPLALADSNPGHVHCAPGGVARNVAHNLALLGHRPALVSLLGDDVLGQSVWQATAAVGVDLRWCMQLPGARSATYLSLHGPDGDMAVAVNDMDILEQLDASRLTPLLAHMGHAQCCVLDANLSPDALACLLGADLPPVLVDAVSSFKCLRLQPWLARIHTLKLNALEAQTLSGLEAHDGTGAEAAARALHSRGVRQLVVSLGADGVVWCDAQGHTGRRAARSVPVVNTSGAGDALLAGLVHGQLQGWPLDQSVAWAMACSEITLQSPHANAPDLSLEALQACVASSNPSPSP
ncbi:MAG: hypothetical protein E6Q78_00545 [Rhodoferax sp.]|nr:MAG: hypothetical protein E6Q78_00545 [Rhodoferax sp.]